MVAEIGFVTGRRHQCTRRGHRGLVFDWRIRRTLEIFDWRPRYRTHRGIRSGSHAVRACATKRRSPPLIDWSAVDPSARRASRLRVRRRIDALCTNEQHEVERRPALVLGRGGLGFDILSRWAVEMGRNGMASSELEFKSAAVQRL
jgi:hypothetical protein